MKAILSIAIYLSFVFALGIISALQARRGKAEVDWLDEDV